MNLLDHLKAAVGAFGNVWHEQIEPSITEFLKNLLHKEVAALTPIAESVVAQFVPAAIQAIKDGNTDGFLDAQWDLAKATADTAKALAINVALTSVGAVAASVMAGHPDVQAATAEKAAQ